ncbi:RNA-guided endonuclease InsQ/TnpB family protein [Scytonema sp. PCC 10023]|uniref:RNA-guided endonuclease InsQ/TnpB family protein n=1 Tax=Scytonema sp. PCC 10023 TaxID=1680591 RepID=UPI0039C65A00
MAVRRQTFRLYPNKQQEAKLLQARRDHCYLYNACIAHRKYEWRANRKSVSYLEQQNCLPAYKKEWVEFAYLHSQALQATVKRVDLAYNAFFQGLRKQPKFKSIRKFSGWTYPATSGWKANTSGKHGSVNLNDLGVKIKMRGQAKRWGKPTTLTIVYKPGLKQWFASFTVELPDAVTLSGSQSELAYNSIVAFDLGCETAITTYNGKNVEQISNPRFTQKTEAKIKKASKELRRKQAPNRNNKVKASRRWKKANKRVAQLQRKAGTQRRDWQHKITSEIASCYDIGVTEQLNTKGMTKKAKKGSKRNKQKAGLNKSILSVGFGTLNKMLTYKIEAKGGLMIMLPTKDIKPSQRCPKCGAIHSCWAELSSRHHACPDCGFEVPRDAGSAMVMYNVVINQQPGLGTSLDSLGCLGSTSKTSKRKNTGSMKQLGQARRQKSSHVAEPGETPSAYATG